MKLQVNGKLHNLDKFNFHLNTKFIIHGIETVNGYYTTDEEDEEMYFFPKWELIGEKFPFHISTDGLDDFETLIDDEFIEWYDLVRVVGVHKKSGEAFIAERPE